MAMEQCGHCQNALDALRHRTETDEIEPLNHDCAMIIASYLTSIIDHKACRCLLKNADCYFAMNQSIVELIELCSSLIATLNEDLVNFFEMEGGTIDASGLRASLSPGVEELCIVGDENESMDLDTSSNSLVPPSSGDVRGFSLDDRKELFHLLPHLLSEQYVFYHIFNKYHASAHDRRLSADKEMYAGNFFDTSGFPPPYVLVLAAVRENNLLERIQECFTNAKPRIMPPQFALKLIQATNSLKRLANEQTIMCQIYPAREAAHRFLCQLIDEQGEMLRDPAVRHCAEQLWTSSRDCLEESFVVDVFGLALIVKHLSSPYLAPRLTGLAQLSMFINLCSELLNTEHVSSAENAAIAIANYLCENKVLKLLFGPNSHSEVLKQCPNLLNFMALYGKISTEDLDCIWSAAQMKHCGRQVFDLLTLIIKGLDPQLILHLYGLLKAMKPSEHSEMTLHLVSCVTKMIWSYALCRTTFAGYPHQPLIPRLNSSATMSAIWGARDCELGMSPEKALNSRLNVSGDSTQASTTGGGDDPCEEMSIEVDEGSKSPGGDGQVGRKNSPPPLIDPDDDGKSPGKRAQREDDGMEREGATCRGEPIQKRARVVVEPALPQQARNVVTVKAVQAKRQPLKVKVEGIVGEAHNSPGNSSTTTNTTESSASGEVDENVLVTGEDPDGSTTSSSDERSSEMDQEEVKRLMQHAKFGTFTSRLPQILPKDSLSAVFGKDVAAERRRAAELSDQTNMSTLLDCYSWMQSSDATSGLLESLVKQKDVSDQRGYDSDSDLSSDGGTSSGRLNDLEEDEELMASNGEAGFDPKDLVLMGHQLQGYRPSHSSPFVLDDLEDEDVATSSAPINQALIIHNSSPSHESITAEPESYRSTRAANRAIQLHFLRQPTTQEQIVAAAAALQFQQQSRNILTQLAPHAKSFWQEKYSQLTEAQKGLFDLNRVCEPGHTLLWDLVVDERGANLPVIVGSVDGELQHGPTSADSLPLELHQYAMQMLEEVVAWAPNIFIKKYFVRGCVERLRSHRSVPIVLQVIRKIMASFRQTWRNPAAAFTAHQFGAGRVSGEEINAVIWADKELNLLAAFFDDLEHFRRHQPSLDGVKAVEQELRARMEFLEYVFSNQGTPTNCLITNNIEINAEQLDILWDCLSVDACGRELLHKWLLDQLKSQTQHALNVELLNHILQNKMVSFQGESLTGAGLAFLQAVLQEGNGKSPEVAAEASVQVCLPLIWSAALRNSDSTVAMAAMTFISNYYVHTGGSAQKEIEFIDSCMRHLRYACEAMAEAQLQATLICIHRAILILRSHLDAFRRRHAFYLRTWELEGHGVKSHMQSVPHAALVDFIPTITLVLQAPGVEKKAALELATSDLLGHLRAEVTHWWKHAKKTSAGVFPLRRCNEVRRNGSAPAFKFDLNSSATASSKVKEATSSTSFQPLFQLNRPVAVTMPVNVVVNSASQSGCGAFVPVARRSATQEDTTAEQSAQNGASNPILGALLSTGNGQATGADGPLRLLFGGRELTADLDEKSLVDIGLRDMATIHVQPGGPHQPTRTGHSHGIWTQGVTSHSPGQVDNTKDRHVQPTGPPDPTSMPMALLSTANNWQLLMDLIKSLIDKSQTVAPDLASKCRSWSYHAWEVIQLLPTYAPFVEKFERVMDCEQVEDKMEGEESRWNGLFDSENLHYFLYSMQCLEMLTQKRDQFVTSGGLKHLINVFMGRSLFPKANGEWSEWEIECLTSILRVIHNFSLGVDGSSSTHASSTATGQGFKLAHGRSTKPHSMEMIVPTLDMAKFAGVDVASLVKAVMDLVATFCSESSSESCSSVSRLRGLQYAFQLLIGLLLNDDTLRKGFRFGVDSNSCWLKLVLLDCHDPNLRREVSASLYRLCRGRTKKGFSGRLLTPRLTVSLLALLKDANGLAPFWSESSSDLDEKAKRPSPPTEMSVVPVAGSSNDQKELFGPSPSSYFWLLTNLLESLLRNDAEPCSAASSTPSAKEMSDEKELADAEFSVDFDAVAAEIAKYLMDRPFYESKFAFKMRQEEQDVGHHRLDRGEQHYQPSDPGLIGLLQTAIAIAKFNPSWKYSQDGEAFVRLVLELIFALPSAKNSRHHPKCQSPQSRVAAYDLLVEMAKGCDANNLILYKTLMEQNSKASHDNYGWEYWPQDERRAPCGYVGLMNLGATCYMASAMQQLYMIPRLRAALLNARVVESTKHEAAFREMQKMFAFLLESERKAYNPRSFCKSYQMNHQPLNITEQKDMAEFFTDLITKLEEMSPDLKRVVKNLFCGAMSNNVVSLDCPHVSKTVEDFYTVRCQVADMKELQDSLSELTIGDMLEGDNMYTCSQCNKKVRAEKRACFQKLPRILCFNTMRYTFNMITMMKEKVNTHFSFPFRLNMAPFMEENLLPSHASGDETNDSTFWYSKVNPPSTEYELIGVTVHTGTADGGHYYSFIRRRNEQNQPSDPESDRWYSFNDADVRAWDPSQMAAECFGGELTRQQYDNIADKYLDLSFEKTNSAYMLFYERVPPPPKPNCSPTGKVSTVDKAISKTTRHPSIVQTKSHQISLPEDVDRWISDDNVRFIQDLAFFDHAYFNFVWQVCAQVPSTILDRDALEITFMSAKLSLSFVLETLLHSKEKATISQWLEIILKDLSSCHKACEWALGKMAKSGEWPNEILIGCPSKSCREVFQKLCLHAIHEIHLKHEQLYLLPYVDRSQPYDQFEPEDIGNQSSVGKFVKRLLQLLISQYASVEIRQLNEYFGLLLEFSKSRPKAVTFLHLMGAINIVCNFYMRRSQQEMAEAESEEELSEEELSSGLLAMVKTGARISSNLWSPSVLERLVKLVTLLFDNGLGPGGELRLRQRDIHTVFNLKGFPFLMNVIKDVSNPNVSGPLVLSVCQGNTAIGKRIIETIFDCLKRPKDETEPYLNLLSYFVDIAEKSIASSSASGPDPGQAPTGSTGMDFAVTYVNLILERMWDLANVKASCALKWLSTNVINHRSIVFDALIDSLETWVEKFLLKPAQHQVRSAAGELLLSLVPSPGIRSSLSTKGISVSPRAAISSEAVSVLHRVYEHLLGLLRHRAPEYAPDQHHSTHRLVAFFQTMKACLVSKDEKLMVVPHAQDIWHLLHKYMMEKPVKINANKQALLTFWYMACVDCPEMVQASIKIPAVHQYFMYNYIHVADDDDELTNSNKVSLHAFYGLMRLFCLHSPSFCEVLIRHENMNFACQSVATKDAYKEAREEIFGAIEICCKQPTINPKQLAEFKQHTWSLFLNVAARSRANFPLLLRFLKIASDTPHDKVLLLQNSVLPICSEALGTLHKMHHEASGCNVLVDLSEMLKRLHELVKFATRFPPNASAPVSSSVPPKLGSPSLALQNVAAASTCGIQVDEKFEEETKEVVAKAVQNWANMQSVLHLLLELLNSFMPPEIRRLSIDCIKEIVVLNRGDSLAAILPEIKQVHAHCRAANTIATSVGPYFPKRGHPSFGLASFRKVQPPRPMFHMCLQSTQLEAAKGVDSTYDQMLIDYFQPYHTMVDRLLRTAFNLGTGVIASTLLVEVSCLLGYEGVPLHSALFPKLWLDLYQRFQEGKDLQKEIECLCGSTLLRDYIDAVLVQEQHSLTNSQIFNFMQLFMDKCQQQIPAERLTIAIDNAICQIMDTANAIDTVLRATASSVLDLSPTSVHNELERMPVMFSRARGAFRALFLAYAPGKLPAEIYAGDLRQRLIEMWTKFKSICKDKTANAISVSPGDTEEQSDASTSTASSARSRHEIESKLRQYCVDFLTDSENVIGTLLGRLEIPEPPIEENEKGDVKKEDAEIKESTDKQD